MVKIDNGDFRIVYNTRDNSPISPHTYASCHDQIYQARQRGVIDQETADSLNNQLMHWRNMASMQKDPNIRDIIS